MSARYRLAAMILYNTAEGRHQQGPRFGARTFVPKVIDEHRVKCKQRFA